MAADGKTDNSPGPRSARGRRTIIAISACGLAALAGIAVAAIIFYGRPGGPRAAGGGEADASAIVPARERLLDRGLFTDITAGSGIDFRHFAGAEGKLWNPETFGPGGGFFDADGDGLLDVLLIDGNRLAGPLDPAKTPRLYRNRGGGHFEDATRGSGLEVPACGMGFAAADVDNDGDPDVLIYGYRVLRLFLNNGSGRFADSTARSGLENGGRWAAAAAFLDYDRDGILDLFLGNYVDWSPEREEGVDCGFGTPRKRYCPVALFPPSAPRLFHGLGGGAFADVSERAGVAIPHGKALGVAVADYDRDGFPDIFVANDSVPNFLFRNRGDGGFEERGLASGLAVDAFGVALAGMGIDCEWLGAEGPLAVAIGNFAGEPATFSVQEDINYFIDRSLRNGVGAAALPRVTFGLLLEDLDLDGWTDLALANGHVFDVEDILGAPYRQPLDLFLGTGPGAFERARPADPGDPLNRRFIGRALAAGDVDSDGDLDLLLTENQGPAHLLRNDAPRSGRAIRLRLQGTRSNRDAIGAGVELDLGARRIRREVKSASSYLAQSERAIVLALRPGESVRAARVSWPSGLIEEIDAAALRPGAEALVVEGKGRPAAAAAAPASMPNAKPPAAAADLANLANLAALERLAAGRPENPVIQANLGGALLDAGRLEEADRAFQRAIALNPADFGAWRSRLMVASRRGRAGEVEALAAEAARRFPDADLLVSHFSAVLRESGCRDAAYRIDLAAAALDPDRIDVWTAIGHHEFGRGLYRSALGRYERAMARNPQAVEALAGAGKARALLREYPQAVELLQRALALEPDHASALGTLGGVLAEIGQLEEAERHLRRAAELAPRDETVHGNLGLLYLRRGDRARAVACFERVLEIAPGDPKTLDILRRLGAR